MNYFYPIIPWTSALIFFLILEGISAYPKSLAYLAPLILPLIVAGIWRLAEQKLYSTKLWRYLITPLIFGVSAVIFFIFLEGRYFRHFYSLGMAVLLWSYLEVIYLRFHSRPRYEPYSLENITIHLDLVAVFLAASSFYSLLVFLNVSLPLLVLIFGAVTALLSLQLIWASGTTLSLGWRYLAVITLVAIEVFYVVSFLPTSVLVNGLLVALSYYLLSGLARNWLLDIKEEKVVKRYLLVCGVCSLIILITAKWF